MTDRKEVAPEGKFHAVASAAGSPRCECAGVAHLSKEPCSCPCHDNGPAQIRMGFHIEIQMHTEDAERIISSPEWVRFALGEVLDKRGLQEEIDYTLEVKRSYEQP